MVLPSEFTAEQPAEVFILDRLQLETQRFVLGQFRSWAVFVIGPNSEVTTREVGVYLCLQADHHLELIFCRVLKLKA